MLDSLRGLEISLIMLYHLKQIVNLVFSSLKIDWTIVT